MYASTFSISVIIPTFNYAHFIVKAVESIINQHYKGNVEIIVLDDGSTDNTAYVLESYIRKDVVKYYCQENAGKAAATRRAIDLATGDIIFNLDADDWFLPGKLQQTVDIFLKYPLVVHVASPAIVVFNDMKKDPTQELLPSEWLGKAVDGARLIRYFYENNILYGGGSTFSARASILKEIRWDVNVDMYTDEWLIIETFLKGQVYFINHPLSVWYVHDRNYSGDRGTNTGWQKKHERLWKSSLAILNLIEMGQYPSWLLKLYILKHKVRLLAIKEEAGTKSIGDLKSVILLLINNKWSVLKAYHIFNRLLPTRALQIGRKLKWRSC